MWCSLVEPTPMYPGGRRGNNSRPHAKIATTSPSHGVARSAPPPALQKSWQVLRGGDRPENWCHGELLGTRWSVQLANTTTKFHKK